MYKPDSKERVVVKDKGSGKDYLEQEIITEPLDTDVLFSANIPIAFGSILHKWASTNERASELYKDALHYFSRRGYRKTDFMTSKEFTGLLSESSYLGSQVMEILMEKYLRLRFGGSNDHEELKNLAKILKKLKRIKARK